MSRFFMALLLTADPQPPSRVPPRTPDLHAAQVCMAAAESMHAVCAEISDSFVPVDTRLDARRRCGHVYRGALERCLVENGIEVTETRRRYWERLEALTETAIACFNRVENELRWCLHRGQDGCRIKAEQGLERCRVERVEAERQLAPP